MAESSAFHLLDERIQRFIWKEGWTELRDAQEKAIPVIVNADRDVIVAAATAAGKTEAAFLPALTHLLRAQPCSQLIAYISPLKALINDQFGRLDRLCEDLEIPVWPWHGDISAGIKARFMKRPVGVLLITPESVEALLCNRGTSVSRVFERAAYFVVDEVHAFIGSERGKQLQSILHRIETAIGRRVPRIGLSATLGDMSLAADFLRPGHGPQVTLVQSSAAATELRILVKGFEEPELVEDPSQAAAPVAVAGHLFKSLRGSNNLVFPNSRREVERYTHLLSGLCEQAGVPNEFWPHHGSLSREIRAQTEAALKQNERPASAVCTNSLELGIDIGAVRSVAQIGPPPSVASLRQRLGRSGRRKGEPAILRGYCIENALTPDADLHTELRLGTVQMAAMISLLLEGWFEPPAARGAHFSTLIQQLLSLIAQAGGLRAGQAYSLLVGKDGPFAGLSTDEFKELLTHLAEEELITQDSSGVLLHGRLGEKFVNHYSFYAAFASDEEFRVVAGAQVLGSLPVSQLLRVGQRILFAGRTWHVDEVNEREKTIYVTQAKGGAPPLFSGGIGRVHTKVRQRMRELLESGERLAYLDAAAQQFLDDGRRAYGRLELKERVTVDRGASVVVLTWLGDAGNEAVACLLNRRGFDAWIAGPGVELLKGERSAEEVEDVLADAAIDDVPPLDMLLGNASNLEREKWDWALPLPLLQKSYASVCLDMDGALDWARRTYLGARDG
jgi:ATP-dependent Lhr-like helicase